MARRETQTYGVRIRHRTRRAPHGAPTRRLRRRAPLRSRTKRPQSSSQLLAGTPSGPGGSPAAARVLHCEARSPRAPHPVPQSRRLARTPLQVDEVRPMLRPVREAGISSFLPPPCGEVRHAFGVLGWGKSTPTASSGRMHNTPPVARRSARLPPHQGEGWDSLRGKQSSAMQAAGPFPLSPCGRGLSAAIPGLDPGSHGGKGEGLLFSTRQSR